MYEWQQVEAVAVPDVDIKWVQHLETWTENSLRQAKLCVPLNYFLNLFSPPAPHNQRDQIKTPNVYKSCPNMIFLENDRF